MSRNQYQAKLRISFDRLRMQCRPVALVAIVALAACGGGGGDEESLAPTADQPAAQLIVDQLADQGCKCVDLQCIDAIQTKFKNIVSRTHQTPQSELQNSDAHRRLTTCVTRLARDFGQQVTALSDRLCACADRACYDALRPDVDRVFDKRNIAAMTPSMLEETKHLVKRFNECDAKFDKPSAIAP